MIRRARGRCDFDTVMLSAEARSFQGAPDGVDQKCFVLRMSG